MHPRDCAVFERHAPQIVAGLEDEAIDVYLFLVERLARVDPQQDRVFQFAFRSFYRLDNAGLTPEFKSEYFRQMCLAKRAGTVDMTAIVRRLYAIPNRKGQRTIQFSFATKLANLLTPTVPLYDAEIAKVFRFSPPSHKLPFETRLLKYLAFLDQVQRTYEEVLIGNRLAKTRAAFRTTFGARAGRIPETKTLDFIFWSAGKLGLRVESDA